MHSYLKVIRNHKLAATALIGLLLSFYYIHSSNRTSAPSSIESPPGRSIYASYLAGTGTIEPLSQNVAIGTASAGIVERVNVAVGDAVESNDILFNLDDQEVLANRSVKLSALEVAKAEQISAKAFLKNAHRTIIFNILDKFK